MDPNENIKDLGRANNDAETNYCIEPNDLFDINWIKTEALVNLVISNSPIIIFSLDNQGIIQFAAGKAIENYGLTAEQIIGKSIVDLITNIDEIKSDIKRALQGELTSMTFQYHAFTLAAWCSPQHNAQGKMIGIIGIAMDITQSMTIETELHRSKERLAEAQRIAHIGNWEWDITKNEAYWSEEMFRIFGLCQKEVQPSYSLFFKFVHPEDKMFVKLSLAQAVKECKPFNFDHRIILPNGTERFVLEQGEYLFDERGEPKRMIGITQDITERKQAEEHLSYLAKHDVLTGLANRIKFKERLAQAIECAARRKTLVAILLLDIDNFKTVNDTLGHEVGDELLRGIASRLNSLFSLKNCIAHLGGDEFAVLVENFNQVAEISEIAKNIQTILAQPFPLKDFEVFITASIGITLYPTDNQDVDNMLRNADSALNEAKSQGRNSFQFFTPAMQTQAFERLILENSMRYALQRNEFLLYYQPVINLARKTISSAEVLLRWQHPQLGLLNPNRFIPLAEQTGFIVPLGLWTIRSVCNQLKVWQDQGFPIQTVAVNLSARQFQDNNLLIEIANVLQEYDVSPGSLEIELTESILLENTEHTCKILDNLRAFGIKIAIDDFGTGYSSLSYIKRFAADKIKLDRSFVKDLTEDPNAKIITSAIINMAHAMHLKVVAEGVESMSQLSMLAEQQCDEIQGFLFGQPMPADNLDIDKLQAILEYKQ